MDKPTAIAFVEPPAPAPASSGGNLLDLAAYLAGRMAKLGVPVPVAGPRLPGCAPWCGKHTGGAPIEDPEAYCEALYTSPVLGTMTMFNNTGYGTGPLFGLWNLRDVEPDLDEMERLALAALAMVYAARNGVAA